MNTPLRCLIVEDSEDDARLVLRQLRDGGYDVTSERVDTPEAMRAALAGQPWDIVISDYKMPRFSGTAALELLKASGLDLPFIIVSGTIGEDQAVAAMKTGAHDYLMKGKLARLVPAVQRELHDARVRCERRQTDAYREIGLEVLRILNEPGDLADSIRRVVAALKTGTGFDAVGIRLQAGEDFPYFAQQGFSKDFLLTENTLLARAAEGGLCRNQDGAVCLECTCGLVISGRTDPANPLFTPGGSCWLNDSFPLLAIPASEDPRLHPRNQCIHHGYASVALVPIRNKERVVGLIQFNDRRIGCFTLATIEILEGIAAHLGEALMRQQVEMALRASERKFQSVFEQAAVGIIVAEGPRGRFVNVNRRFCEMVGYTAAELLQLSSHDITHPNDLAADSDELEQISFGVVREFSREKRYRRKDGSFVWAKVYVAPLDASEAKPTLRIGVIADISERKRAEEDARIAHERLRRLVDANVVGVVIGNSTGGIFEANDYFLRLIGHTREELEQGQIDWHALTPADWHASEAEAIRTLREKGASVPYEKEYFRRDGTRVPVLIVGAFLPGPEEQLAVFVLDLTERKQAEEALRREQTLFTELARTIPDHIYFKDRQSRFLRINDALARRFGLRRPEEAVGKTDADVFSGEHARHAYADDQRIMTTGEPVIGVEEKETWADGHVTWVSTTKVPLRDAEGTITGLVGISRDITEKKLLEEKFFHAQRLESIGMLAAGVAHDLNNVLAPIVFAAPMLRDSLPSARDLKILETLERSAARGAGLVKQILSFAHTTVGELRPTQVKHLARDVIGMVEETFPKSIQLEQSIPSDLWLVVGNPTQVHQVLMNLVVNARDAMPSGGTLTISAANCRLNAAQAAAKPDARPGDWVVLEVSDTGTGIAPEALARIWNPFFTTKAVGKGTGLGLSTVRGIVLSHHGFVELQTEFGHGTTFRVYLPANEGESPRRTSVSPFKLPEGENELILVVEDDQAVRDSVSAIIRQHGYRVQSCADGGEAITYFTAGPNEIALVLTDVDMPHLGGAALASALRQLRPDLPLIVMSGLSREEPSGSDVQSARDLAQAFLTKPFTAEVLIETIQRVLHQSAKP